MTCKAQAPNEAEEEAYIEGPAGSLDGDLVWRDVQGFLNDRSRAGGQGVWSYTLEA